MAVRKVLADRPSAALHGAPLCPAGHLPHEGGDRLSRLLSPITNVAEEAPLAKLPISPQVGEMSGRTEGGAKDRGLSKTP
ncbi:MAG: hypothetical protein E5Y32_12890 [Mesorhizobium sp.]|nr:MAG: hypothetical protein E5Y86_28210 [Mesorhizobium sp.]TIL85513.1 MAG: hypothetical protein E5Y73_29290 [Mesorhizobium sp.]TIM45219.1 MAG: hypothetical protein E5Y56_14560 [Mesorhizobium sp.]TIN45644.1 MAG: hypothetical protein E5Y32_12890 [Mesorhizobium sp.]